MNRVVSLLSIKTLDAEQRIIEGWATRSTPDRVGDVVESKGAVFKLPLSLLLDHNHTAAIGEVIEATAMNDGIRFKAKLAKIEEPGPLKELCDDAWTMVRSGLRKAVSIGFRPLDMEPIPGAGMRFKKWEWFELSLVSVPALAGATIDTVKSYDRTLRAARRGTLPIRVVRLADPVRSV